MKITDFAILFVILMAPLFLFNDVKIDTQIKVQEVKLGYNAAIQAAVQDGTKVLLTNEKQVFESGYESSKSVSANKQKAIDAFFRTLYINFDIVNDPIAQGTLRAYIPVLVVIDYDGYYVYTTDEYKNVDGETEVKHVWMPKKPYAYRDNENNSLSFTLDSYVVAYDRQTDRWHEGFRSDINNQTTIPLLDDPTIFEEVRRTTIVQAIQKDLEFYINRHNTYAIRYGITYTFTLPVISQEEWNNTINEVGMITTIQGLPIGREHYNSYALGGTRTVKKSSIYGSIINGIKYAYRSDCAYSYPVLETFQTQKEAAEHGYLHKSCNNR